MTAVAEGPRAFVACFFRNVLFYYVCFVVMTARGPT